MCRVMDVHPSGFYAWLKQPHSKRYIEDERLLGHIKQAWVESGFAYGYRNITNDLKDLAFNLSAAIKNTKALSVGI